MPFTTNQALFEFFANEHDLLLTESEMYEIIRQVKLAIEQSEATAIEAIEAIKP